MRLTRWESGIWAATEKFILPHFGAFLRTWAIGKGRKITLTIQIFQRWDD